MTIINKSGEHWEENVFWRGKVLYCFIAVSPNLYLSQIIIVPFWVAAVVQAVGGGVLSFSLPFPIHLW